jgi:ectoine hydroxylase-related dioxygenase (phytanoyl-CoA dioxygenase family)
LQSYSTQGYVCVPGVLSDDEIACVRREIPTVFSEDSPRRVVEQGTGLVRSVYGMHQTNEVFARLARHPALVEPAMQIVDGEVYLYQFKVNAKAAFGGDVWQWHQDYIFWRNEDGLPSPRITNVTLFLDDVTEFNGPIFLLPGSHREGVIEAGAAQSTAAAAAPMSAGMEPPPSWTNNLTANLKYSLGRDTVAALCTTYGIVAPKAPAGSVLFFHPDIVHASAQNISPFDRMVVIATYCSVENRPLPREERRPDFLASRDYTSIAPLAEGVLPR